jgi:hypothetical protein
MPQEEKDDGSCTPVSVLILTCLVQQESYWTALVVREALAFHLQLAGVAGSGMWMNASGYPLQKLNGTQ